MILTEKNVIRLTIEQWKWMVETGSNLKGLWPRRKTIKFMRNSCPLCEYAYRKHSRLKAEERLGIYVCSFCPYYKRFGSCVSSKSPYKSWILCKLGENSKWAQKLVDQLEQLL